MTQTPNTLIEAQGEKTSDLESLLFAPQPHVLLFCFNLVLSFIPLQLVYLGAFLGIENSFHGYLGILSTQIQPLKSITPILFYK